MTMMIMMMMMMGMIKDHVCWMLTRGTSIWNYVEKTLVGNNGAADNNNIVTISNPAKE